MNLLLFLQYKRNLRTAKRVAPPCVGSCGRTGAAWEQWTLGARSGLFWGLANYSPQAKSRPARPMFVNKVLPICSRTIYGCFHVTMAAWLRRRPCGLKA